MKDQYLTVFVRFMQVLFNIANADYQHSSSVEKFPAMVYTRNLLALIQVITYSLTNWIVFNALTGYLLLFMVHDVSVSLSVIKSISL